MIELTVVLLFQPGREPSEENITRLLENEYDCDVIRVEEEEY